MGKSSRSSSFPHTALQATDISQVPRPKCKVHENDNYVQYDRFIRRIFGVRLLSSTDIHYVYNNIILYNIVLYQNVRGPSISTH